MEISILPLGSYGANCYVLSDEDTKNAIVIDPGADGAQLNKALENLGLHVKKILITHSHFDHNGGAKELHESTGAPVYIHTGDLHLPESLSGGNIFYTDTYDEGSLVDLDSIHLEILHTSGHSEGSVCIQAEGAIFTGDTLFRGNCGRVDFEGGDWKAMEASLRRLSALPETMDVYPGHGEQSTIAYERSSNPYMRQALQQ